MPAAALPAIKDGIVEIDDIPRERTATLKTERERAKAALDRAHAQCGTTITIDTAKIDVFARLTNEKLDSGDINARKPYVRAIVDAIEVDERDTWTVGIRGALQSVIAGRQTTNENVRGFVSNWRDGRDKTANTSVIEIAL